VPGAARERGGLGQIAPLAFAAAVAATLIFGWSRSEEGHLTPETGTGYWLGIAGASAIFLLLIYPLRKRMKSLRILGSVSTWFRIHMILGIIGPTLILFHSNFKLGSLNSNVALFSMLTVAASGLIGRYLYTRVHLGLYGRRAEIKELLADVENLKNAIEGGVPLPADLFASLDAYAAYALAGRRGAAASLFTLLALRIRSPRERTRLMRQAERQIRHFGRQRAWSWRVRRRREREIRDLLRQYFAAVKKAAAFNFYEGVFALWHVLHMPLFALLVLAVVIHVIAVHLY
jgi:hypothetical protein